MAPATASTASRDTSSSGGKVFAKASKDWTIPPRPKPGRKAAEPSAVPAVAKASKVAPSKNREAQRAFRERKQDYVAELEAKIREYEKEEVQKNISLQNVGRQLKIDNQNLLAENERLRLLLKSLGHDPDQSSSHPTTTIRSNSSSPSLPAHAPPDSTTTNELSSSRTTRARSTVSSVSGASGSSEGPRKRRKAAEPTIVEVHESEDTIKEQQTREFSLLYQQDPSPPSLSSSIPLTVPTFPSNSPPNLIKHNPFSPSPPPPLPTSSSNVDSIKDCGFCSINDTACVCRIAAEEAASALISSSIISSSSSAPRVSTTTTTPTTVPVSSGIDIPSHSIGMGALPLRLRRNQHHASSPSSASRLWAIDTFSSPSSSTVAAAGETPSSLPMCTGDPSACPACADDKFGKAFCETLAATDDAAQAGTSSISTAPPLEAADAPSTVGVQMQIDCCGMPGLCGSHKGECEGTSEKGGSSTNGSVSGGGGGDGTIPVSDAWRQFKSHPNTRFADLALLAEVVSRGPSHTALSPSSAPSSSPFFATSTSTPLVSSSRARSSSPAPPDANDDGTAHAEAVVAAANARHHARRIQVDEQRVREALRMLDARSFSSASGGGSGLAGGVGVSVGEGGVGLGEQILSAVGRKRRMSDLRGT